jgi:hypothetical protein
MVCFNLLSQSDFVYAKKGKKMTVFKKESNGLINWELEKYFDGFYDTYFYSVDTLNSSESLKEVKLKSKISFDSLNIILNRSYWFQKHYDFYSEFDFYKNFEYEKDYYEFDSLETKNNLPHTDFIKMADSCLRAKKEFLTTQNKKIASYLYYSENSSQISLDNLVSFTDTLKTWTNDSYGFYGSFAGKLLEKNPDALIKIIEKYPTKAQEMIKSKDFSVDQSLLKEYKEVEFIKTEYRKSKMKDAAEIAGYSALVIGQIAFFSWLFTKVL